MRFLKSENANKRPVSARIIFHNNLSKKKDLQQLFELVKRPNNLSSYNNSKWGGSRKARSTYRNRPRTSYPNQLANRNLSTGRRVENTESEITQPVLAVWNGS